MIELNCGCKIIEDQSDDRKKIIFCDKHLKEAMKAVEENGGLMKAEGEVGAGELTVKALNALESVIERIIFEEMPEGYPSDPNLN